MATLENEYYLRSILLLCEGGSYIAKHIIDRELPRYVGDLDALLKQFKIKLKHEFHEKQIEKLFPNNGYDKTDINKWDIQMLIGVLLLLFRKTLSDEEKQNLRELKLIRHEVLAHSPSASLYLEKYEDTQKQLSDAINTLACGFDLTVQRKCKVYIKIYESGPLEVKSAIKRLQEAKDTDDLFQEVIKVIRKTQDTLSKQIHTAESKITQVVKSTEENISKGVKSMKQNISQEVKDSTKVLSKEITLVEGSVRFTKEALTKELDEIKSSECNTFKALMDVSEQIKNLQAWLMQNKTQQSHDRTSTDLQHISEGLRIKSVEISKRISTYDNDSSQPLADGTITEEKNSSQLQNHKLYLSKILVVAIDFGTTHSGYAFSFKSQYDRDPLHINTCTFPGPNMLVSNKVPTTVLFDARNELHSFGYEAEDKYYDLASDNEHHDWYFFRRFKMKLHTERVARNSKLQADNGYQMMAIDVFAAVIRFFKDHLMRLLQRNLEISFSNEILWVLTVPAIWTDQAKQFMRQAANKAGIEDGNLSIALEPEAASIYCQSVDLDRDRRFATIRAGTKYMVIDLGGGTVDITVHEKQSDGGLKELHKASGGAWGGTKVDEEFYRLISTIVSEDVFRKFCDENKEEYLELQREFETKKQNQSSRSTEKITIKIPFVLEDIFEKETGKYIPTAVRESKYDGNISWCSGKLRIDVDIWNSLFKPCCDSIVRHISYLLKDEAVKGTCIFLMVGGFSNCETVQNAVNRAFPSMKVIIPEEPELAVLKGAVLFGHRPLAITSRISKYTYGVSISPIFDRSIHPEFRRVTINGTYRCRDVFKKYIYAGENVRVGDARSGEHATLFPRQKEMKLKMYVSTHPNPMYVDEKDTECIGNLIVHLPESDTLSVINVKMMFGGTELLVEATELSGNKKYVAYFDFL